MRLLSLLFLALASPAFALEPKDVWLVVNKNVPESRQVADHYIARRGVPKTNVVELDLPKGEDISRADYDAKFAGPLRDALADKKDAAKVLVTTYGVPLRVGGQQPDADEKLALEKLRPELAEVRKKVAELEKNKDADPKELAEAKRQVRGLEGRERRLAHAESHACVDSELMLLWWDKYPLDRWVANPLYMGARDTVPHRQAARGPRLAARRAVGGDREAAGGRRHRGREDRAEGEGGDRRPRHQVRPEGRPRGTGYGGYDESMREAAAILEKAGFTVELDDKEPVLKPGAAKGVALYCGWYSHANFVDCCEYECGAVAWHLASSEAVTLRDGNSKVWCPNLLKKGVCATLGPVAEPYTIGFPKPAEFFGLLATGEYTLVECYARTMLFCSWMTVLVGDPLYNPYKGAGRLKAADVVPSPKGAK